MRFVTSDNEYQLLRVKCMELEMGRNVSEYPLAKSYCKPSACSYVGMFTNLTDKRVIFDGVN